MRLESISKDGKAYAHVIHSGDEPDQTAFLTSDDAVQQVGFIVHDAGSEVKRHYHLPVERTIVGTPEVLVVRSGRCEMEVYDDDQELVAVRELKAGDVMIMAGGGHGFRFLEQTILLEVKQGPYFGADEKRYF
jgi:hypothetical protein